MTPLRRPPSTVPVPTIVGDAAGGEGPPQVPRDTSPTWELELLISGAVIFALLQLPPLVDAARDWLSPRLSLGPFALVTLVHMYAKAILYALIASFVLHLSARAYWVALVGLDSVFPAGVRWDDIRVGPITRALYRERLPRLPKVIERTDNVCSVIFATGFLAAFMFGFSLLVAAAVTAATMALSFGLLGGEWMPHLFLGISGVIFLVPLLGTGIDKLAGARISPSGGLGRLLRRVAGVNYRLNMVGVYGPISMTLFSNIRKKVIYPVYYLFFFGLLLSVVLEGRMQRDGGGLDGYAYVPDDAGEMEVDPRHYENQRMGRDAYSAVPFVQADMVREPYVRLFIPYAPLRHNEALARECPAAARSGEEGGSRAEREARAAATLACIARIHALEVNGVARPELEMRFYTHPATEMKGMLVYIPTANLPRGRNVITVQRPAVQPPSFVRAPRDPVTEYLIPFWL